MIMKRLLGCAKSWFVVDLGTKVRKISLTNDLMAIGMKQIQRSKMDYTRMDGCRMKEGAHYGQPWTYSREHPR
jgi:hypothetical protein